jgi:hypothetical protein
MFFLYILFFTTTTTITITFPGFGICKNGPQTKNPFVLTFFSWRYIVALWQGIIGNG